MRRIAGLFLVLAFVIGVCSMALAQVEAKREELVKVRLYIKVLDKKIEDARAAKNINKIAVLNEQKRKELARADALSKEIAILEAKPPVAGAVAAEKRGGLQAEGGYGGGAGMIGLGYSFSAFRGVDLLVDAAYGIGNQYSILNANVAGIFPFGVNYAGLAVGMANYSEKVTDIPGVSGNIDKGSKFGFGVIIGRAIGALRAQIGYNTALGVTAGAVYKF